MSEATDLLVRLRERASTGDALAKEAVDVIEAFADEIDRLGLFERYANSTIRGQVADAIEAKIRTGKYPFED